MDQLLQQQELYLSPISGSFDVEQVMAVARPLGFSLQDPVVPSIFMIFDNEVSRDKCEAELKRNPEAPLPYVLIIKIEPDEILVNQFAGPDYAEYSRSFLSWLLSQYPCEAWNEEGTDLTAQLPKA